MQFQQNMNIVYLIIKLRSISLVVEKIYLRKGIIMILKFLEKYNRYRNPVKYWRKKGCIIGNDCEIYPTANFGSEPFLIKIGNHVRINSGVQLVTHDGGVWVLRYLFENLRDIDIMGSIRIGNNVHIGTNSIIMPGVTIGNNVIIGVGAVVTKNIPDNSIAVGIPAKVIETIDDYKLKHEKDFIHTKFLDRNTKKKILLSYLKIV